MYLTDIVNKMLDIIIAIISGLLTAEIYKRISKKQTPHPWQGIITLSRVLYHFKY